jgi:hypothetical protein
MHRVWLVMETVAGGKNDMTFRRIILAALTAASFAGGSVSHAQAQQSPAPSGWTFNIAPYMWLPKVNATLNYNLPPELGGRLPTDVSTDPGKYLSNLHFTAMFAAEARYDRFAILTDYMYVNGGVGDTHIKSLDFFGLPSQPISRTLVLGTSSSLKATVWTLAGGYAVFEGDWGNFDVLAGLRFLGLYANTNYNLALTVIGPRGNGATFGGANGISGSGNIWNGIAGMRGRVRLPVAGLFIPYYFDIGAGGSKLTWQIASGLGYQTGWVGVSVLYRHLSFEQNSSRFTGHLAMSGPMVLVNFSF